MKPLLASLVLLLLALCRPSSSLDVVIQSSNTKTQKSTVQISAPPAQIAKAEEQLTVEQKAAVKANEKELLTLVFAFGFVLENQQPAGSSKAAMDNGISCILKKQTGAAITSMIYQGKGRAAWEDEAAKKVGIDCAKTKPEDTCFCSPEKHTIFFCVAHIYQAKNGAGTGTCKEEALAELKAAGTQTLGKAYDYDEMAKNENSGAINAVFNRAPNAVDQIIKQADEQMTNFFCDAIDDRVEAKVKQLLVSDYSYQVVEGVIALAVFETKARLGKVEAACQNNAELKKDVFGQCLCGSDLGFMFCVYKAMGKYFEKEGFLDCKTKKFVPEKKPATVPELVPAALLAGSSSTSSLMMVPLMAAAVLLARH